MEGTPFDLTIWEDRLRSCPYTAFEVTDILVTAGGSGRARFRALKTCNILNIIILYSEIKCRLAVFIYSSVMQFAE